MAKRIPFYRRTTGLNNATEPSRLAFDPKTGTVAAINYFKDLSKKNKGNPRIVELDGRPGVKEVSNELLSKLK